MNLISDRLRGINPIYLSFEDLFSPTTPSTYPCYFLREKQESDKIVYEFCITGIGKENLEISIEGKYLNVKNKKEKSVICGALINKYDKLNLKSIKASLNNGILSVMFDHKFSEKISINIE